jgi:carboxymethylenebutenolidase
MFNLPVEDQTTSAYLAVPEGDKGPGILVLHAWWGLNPFFKDFCDRLAGEGFVALAPDLYDGRIAATIDEAEQLVSRLNFDETKARVMAAVDYLYSHPAVNGKGIGAVGFSLGGSWALLVSSLRPEILRAAVIFYGSGEEEFDRAQAAFQGHFAEVDEWEPLEGIRMMEADMRAAGREVTIYTYPNAGHWFFEANRPDAYNPDAARLAWERAIDFLHKHLDQQ